MSASDVTTLISSIGFPIVMCGVLCYYVKYLTDNFNTSIEKVEDLLIEIKCLIKGDNDE